ncbi:anti-sigma factor [Leucobacter sp. HY1908]
MNLGEFRQLSAGHALHALSAADEAAFTRALTEHPEWRYIVDDDLETTAALGDAVPGAEPPASLRASLLDQIALLPQQAESGAGAGAGAAAAVGPALPEPATGGPEPAATEPGGSAPIRHRRVRRRRRMWVAGAFALAASLAVFAAITLGPQLLGSVTHEDPAVVALAEVTGAGDAQQQTAEVAGGGEATLHWSQGLDRALLVTDGLPQLPSGEDFEVWLVRGETPISAGVLADGSEPALLSDFESGDTIAVTVEQAGGSPTGAPTTDPLVAITTAAL